MAKRNQQRAVLKEKQSKRNLFLVPFLILFAKVIFVFSSHTAAWLGSDGESYIRGAVGLLTHGLFSNEPLLSYWPAGYPIVIWILASITRSRSLVAISIFQSIVYFGASAYFAEIIRRSRMKKLAWPLALVLGLNPTLSLSSLVVGYESLVASCLLLSVAVVIRFQQEPRVKALPRYILIVGLIQSFSAFMQPRDLVLGFAIFLAWGIYSASRKSLLAIVVGGTILMMLLPLGLILRNEQSIGRAVISTNLGLTMSIGAGDKATGGYAESGGVACPPKPPELTASDNELAVCVLNWYLHHPKKTAELAVRKSLYFWSPWYGPLANGTMARNPWLKFDPIRNIDTTRQGHQLVYGWFGKVVSWVWLLAGLLMIFLGFQWLWKTGGLERQMSVLTGAPVLLAWLTAIGTIGDHRFRLPTLGLSLFLQVAGYFGLKARFAPERGRAALEPRGKAR